MKKIRYLYWIVKSFVLKHKKIIIPAALAGAITFTQLGLILTYLPKPKPTRLIGRVGNYTLSNLPKDIQLLVSQGLTVIDDTGHPQSGLAKEWQILDDGKTYLFTLKDDLKWQDGTTLTTQDITYNIPDTQIEIIDDKTIAFKLQSPFAPFPTVVSQPLFKRTQKKLLQIIDRSYIIGTRNYQINKITYDGNFIDSITLDSGTDKVKYNFYETESSAILAFKLAEIDIIEDFSSTDDIVTWNNVSITTDSNLQRFVAVYFNTTDENLSSKNVRQALSYAIPNKTQGSTRALGPISPTSWAYNPNVKPYDYDFAKAQELVKDSNTDFSLELTTTPTYTKLAEEIKASWEQLGIQVKVKVVNIPDTQNYQALLIGQQVPLDPDQYLMWHSTQNSNITRYNSPKVDKLLETGRTELDVEQRKLIYLDFQRFLLEDSPAAFLFYLDTKTLSRS